MSYINDLFFGYSTGNITNSNRVNQLLGFEEVVEILSQQPTEEYQKISQLAIKTLENGGSLSDVKAKIDHLKRDLKPMLFSGYRQTGHGDTNGDFDYNGVVQVDLDFKIKGGALLAKFALQAIKNLPYVLIATASPSGVGVKAMVSTTNTAKENHKNAVAEVTTKIAADIGVELEYFDTIGYGSVCYAPMNPALHVNRDAVQFKITEAVPVEELVKAGTAKIITLTSQPHEVNARLKSGLEKALLVSPQFNTIGIQKFAGTMSAWAIDFEVGYQFLVENGYGANLTNNNNKGLKSLRDLCSKNAKSAKYGQALSQVVEVKPLAAVKPDLVVQQFLSEVSDQIEISNRLLVVAPTGSGKTTWVKSLSQPRIMVVPTRVMVDQIASETSAQVFYGSSHKAKTSDDFIVTTYASLPTLSNKFGPTAMSRYTLFLDEMHVFTSNSSQSFQHQQLRDSLQVIEQNNWVGLTATPLFNFAEQLKPNRTVVITRESNPVKSYATVGCTSKITDQVILGAVESKKRGRKSFVFLNNTQDDGKYGEVVTGLEQLGLSVASVNAQAARADNDLFDAVTVSGDMTDADVVLATSLFKEGISVRKGFGSEIDIHIVGTWHPMEIEQFSNRARGVKSINAFIYKSAETLTEHNATETDPNTRPVDIESVRNWQAERAIAVAAAFNDLCQVTTVTRNNIKIIAGRIESADSVHYDPDTNTCVSDSLLLSNRVYEIEKQLAATRNEYMEWSMGAYSWKRLPDCVGTDSLEESVTNDIQAAITTAADLKEQIYNTELDKYQSQTVEAVIAYITDCENGTVDLPKTDVEKAQYLIASRLTSICRAFGIKSGSLNKQIDVLKYIGKNNTGLSKMWNIVKMNRVLTTPSNSIDYLAYTEIKNMYMTEFTAQPNTKFLVSEMCAAMHMVLNDKYRAHFGEIKLSNSKSGIEFNTIFETKSVKVSGDVVSKAGTTRRGQVSAFEIVGLAIDPFYRLLGIDRNAPTLDENIERVTQQSKNQVIEHAAEPVITTSASNPSEFSNNFIKNLKTRSKPVIHSSPKTNATDIDRVKALLGINTIAAPIIVPEEINPVEEIKQPFKHFVAATTVRDQKLREMTKRESRRGLAEL